MLSGNVQNVLKAPCCWLNSPARIVPYVWIALLLHRSVAFVLHMLNFSFIGDEKARVQKFEYGHMTNTLSYSLKVGCRCPDVRVSWESSMALMASDDLWYANSMLLCS